MEDFQACARPAHHSVLCFVSVKECSGPSAVATSRIGGAASSCLHCRQDFIGPTKSVLYTDMNNEAGRKMNATWQFERRTAVSCCNPFRVATWGLQEKLLPPFLFIPLTPFSGGTVMKCERCAGISQESLSAIRMFSQPLFFFMSINFFSSMWFPQIATFYHTCKESKYFRVFPNLPFLCQHLVLFPS